MGERPDPDHPLLRAVQPLLDRVGGRLVAPNELRSDDVPLAWEGETVAGVRLVEGRTPGTEAVGDLGLLLEELSRELGQPLQDLPRADKQRAVRLLEERGAFTYRRSAETVAEALGVTRFTVYNYLNRARA
jgi:DNA-directed RNA polymerase specialized sigma24 family protein